MSIHSIPCLDKHIDSHLLMSMYTIILHCSSVHLVFTDCGDSVTYILHVETFLALADDRDSVIFLYVPILYALL